MPGVVLKSGQGGGDWDLRSHTVKQVRGEKKRKKEPASSKPAWRKNTQLRDFRNARNRGRGGCRHGGETGRIKQKGLAEKVRIKTKSLRGISQEASTKEHRHKAEGAATALAIRGNFSKLPSYTRNRVTKEGHWEVGECR